MKQITQSIPGRDPGSEILPPLDIGDVRVPLPIVQGGMGIGVSLSGLASAVANAGGLGVIATAGIGWREPDFKTQSKKANSRALAKEIRRARDLTSGVLGVNIMVALTNYDDLVATAVDNGADVIFSGAGLPMSLPGLVKGAKSPKLAPIVSSARAASIICRKWIHRHDRLPDALVVEGPKAGGHLGFKPEQISDPKQRLENLVTEVVAEARRIEEAHGVRIPVIAAGGIFTGGDIRAILALGASAAQMGTRFVATHECDAAPEFKRAYLEAGEGDMCIIKSPVGMPGRALGTSFVRRMMEGERKPTACPYHCLSSCKPKDAPFCISEALIRARQGDVEEGLIFAGANAYRVKAIVSVAELMRALVSEYQAACPALVSATA